MEGRGGVGQGGRKDGWTERKEAMGMGGIDVSKGCGCEMNQIAEVMHMHQCHTVCVQ